MVDNVSALYTVKIAKYQGPMNIINNKRIVYFFGFVFIFIFIFIGQVIIFIMCVLGLCMRLFVAAAQGVLPVSRLSPGMAPHVFPNIASCIGMLEGPKQHTHSAAASIAPAKRNTLYPQKMQACVVLVVHQEFATSISAALGSDTPSPPSAG